MNTKNIVATLSLLGLFALNPSAAVAEDFGINAVAYSAATRSDHEAVAKYYEDLAIQTQEKVREQRQLLEHYEDKSYLYGRQAQDLQAHTDALIRKYEKEASANIKEAAWHRQLASKLEENSYSASRLSAVGAPHQNTVSEE